MKKKVLLVLLVLSVITLSGCNWLSMGLTNLESQLKGLEMSIQTYDEESQLIDRITGKSINLSADSKFDLTDSDGNTVEKSSVISATVGGKQMLHVGSSLIAYENGLVDMFNEYSKTVDIENFDKSIPFLNSMVNSFKNLTTGKDKIILIRSQSGKPLATFAGSDVSYFSADIDKSTALLVDGKFLFIYRCDYTIYDIELLQ